MAVRQATRRYPDLASFVAEYEGTLRAGALMLPPEALGGQEPAPEIKLDLQLPIVGRVGPILAQVVARSQDGGVALRLPEIPASVEAGFKRVFDAIAEVRQYLLDSGELVAREERDALRALLASLSSMGGDGEEVPQDEEYPAEQPEALVEDGEDSEPAGDDEELIDDEAPAADDELLDAEDEAVDDAPTPAAAPVRSPPVPVAPVTTPAPRARAPSPVRAHPDISARSPTVKGNVQENGLRNQMISLQLQRETGLLRVTTPDGTERHGYWRDGGPVWWRADPPIEDEQLGALLERSGQLSPARRQASLDLMAQRGLRQGEALIELGVLRPEHVPVVLARQVEYVVSKVLSLKGGTWGFYRLDELPEDYEAAPTSVIALLYRAYVGHARKIPPRDMLNLLRKRWDHSARLMDAAIPALRDVRYTREEAVIFDAIRTRPRPIRDLMGGAAGDGELVGPVLWTLGELGLLEYSRGETSDVRDQRLRQTIQTRLDAVRELSHFDALDLHWICLPEDVTRNAARLREELGLSALDAMSPDTRAVAEPLAKRLDEAVRELSDDGRRRAYRASLVSAEDIARCADLLCLEGEQLLQEAQPARALTCFAKALELDPKLPEAKTGLQRAT